MPVPSQPRPPGGTNRPTRNQQRTNRAPLLRDTPSEFASLYFGRTPANFPKIHIPIITEGHEYEELTLALTFLRCMRHGLNFQLSSNNRDAGKFDDLVVKWADESSATVNAMLVQLKHRSSPNGVFIGKKALLPREPKSSEDRDVHKEEASKSNAFSISWYWESYRRMSDTLKQAQFILVLSTNARLSKRALDLMQLANVGSTPGTELIDTGGDLYRLDPNNPEVKRAVNDDTSFLCHFFIFCGQKDIKGIKDQLRAEVKKTVADKCAVAYLSDSLCTSIREWRLEEAVWLNRDWSKWKEIESDLEAYLKLCKRYETNLIFDPDENLRKWMDENNPCWVEPLPGKAVSITISKIHRAVSQHKHLILTLKELEYNQLIFTSLWVRSCKWLVIIDERGRLNIHSKIYQQLFSLLGSSRRLLIVSSANSNSFVDTFVDTFQVADVSDKTWRKLLDTEVVVNGLLCGSRLRDFVGSADDLKNLLASRSEELVALFELRGQLNLGRDLGAAPSRFVPRDWIERRRVSDEFFTSLAEEDICVVDDISSTLIPMTAPRTKMRSFTELHICLTAHYWLAAKIVVLDRVSDLYIRSLSIKNLKYNVYFLSHTAYGWEVLFFIGKSDKIRRHVAEEEKQPFGILATADSKIILEGKAGVGKSVELQDVARCLKAIDPKTWVIRVNLPDLQDKFSRSFNAKDSVRYISTCVVCNEGSLGKLEYLLLRHCLSKSPHIAVLVDGFSQVTRGSIQVHLEMLNELAPSRGKLIVTSRPGTSTVLEESFGLMAHKIPPFSNDQLEMFVQQRSLTVPENVAFDLLRIPLFCLMSADLTNSSSYIHDVLTLHYSYFICKLKAYIQSKGNSYRFSRPFRGLAESQHIVYQQQLMLFAAAVLMNDEVDVENMGVKLSDLNAYLKCEILDEQPEGVITFRHSTFGEYFLANWALTATNTARCATFYCDAILNSKLEFFVECFDRLTCRRSKLLTLVVDGDASGVKELLCGGADPTEVDEVGRSGLHLAAARGDLACLDQLLAACGGVVLAQLEAHDGLLGWTPLRYARELRFWSAAATLQNARDTFRSFTSQQGQPVDSPQQPTSTHQRPTQLSSLLVNNAPSDDNISRSSSRKSYGLLNCCQDSFISAFRYLFCCCQGRR